MSSSEYLSGLDKSDLVNEIRDLKKRVRSLELKKVNYNQVDEVTNDLGLMLAGEFRAGNGVEPGEGFSGVRMNADGVNGYDNDVLQAGLSATDGKITAGAGAVTLNADGISITGDASENYGAVIFYDGDGSAIGEFRAYPGNYTRIKGLAKSGVPTNVALIATGYGHTPDTNDGIITILASDNINQRYVLLQSTDPYIYFNNVGLKVNSALDDRDSVFNGTSGAVLTVDAGNNDVDIATSLDVSGDVTTATLGVTGAATIGTTLGLGDTGVNRGGYRSMDDDTAVSITPVESVGVVMFYSNGIGVGITVFGAVIYNTNSPATVLMFGGSNVNVATGALAGTTGTDGKFTVSAHTDGKIYFENRRGGAVYLRWNLFSGV